MITPSFYLALATFTRQRDQAIGIHHETTVQERLYMALDESLQKEAANIAMANEIRANMDTDRRVLKNLLAEVDTAVDKQELLHRAKNIEQRILLATECLEVLSNG